MKTRRNFIRDTSLLTAGSVATSALPREVLAQNTAPLMPELAMPKSEKRGEMIYRALGATGEMVSIVGLGGAHIGSQKDPDESVRLIRMALDNGINFLDNCWDYNGGESEVRMGRALQDGYRDKAFLMTKIDGRTKDSAAKQIDESLKRLQTDHIDLMQIHEIIRLEDPDVCFAPGGTMDAIREAKQAGKIRYIGFTGHKDPLVFARMLDVAKAHETKFDTAQMPINVMDAHFRSFTRDIVPRLVAENIGVLGMKCFGGGAIMRFLNDNQDVAKPIDLLHYAMSQPVAVVITGCQNEELVQQAIQAGRTFAPMSAPQQNALLAKTREAALTGRYEKFKTTQNFDGTAKNPQWLG